MIKSRTAHMRALNSGVMGAADPLDFGGEVSTLFGDPNQVADLNVPGKAGPRPTRDLAVREEHLSV